jgi:hypothetical protein
MRIWKDKLLRADLLLLLLYVAYCGAVILRVNIEGTGYTSPDSEYYLEAARSLRDGERFIVKDLYGLHTGVVNKLTPFTAWPIGYPTLIVIASFMSGLNLFWASKLVNLFFAGLGFLLFRNINREYSFILASIYGAFTVIEMYSYTWSECIFLFGCMYLVFLLYRTYLTGRQDYIYRLVATVWFMFLIRYIGFFAGGLILFVALITLFEGRKKISKKLWIAFFLNVAFVCAYVINNYYQAGYNTDAQRFTQNMESPAQVLWRATKGLLIELFIIKKYYLRGSPDTLTVATFSLQLFVIGYIWHSLRKQSTLVVNEIKKNLLSHTAITVAISYLIILVILRSISQFDPPNYRLLSPFSFLMLFALVNYIVALPQSIEGATRTKYAAGGFLALSLLLNLPKKFLLSYFSSL